MNKILINLFVLFIVYLYHCGSVKLILNHLVHLKRLMAQLIVRSGLNGDPGKQKNKC